MKIVRNENQHNDFERNSVVVHCWKEEFDIQDLILICFEFRMFFDFKNKKTSSIKRCFRYLNKTMKIEFELRISLHLCLFEKKYDLEIIETFLYFWKENKISKFIKMLLYLLKNQLLTKVDFKKCLQFSS
jgi:hypothetical protein